MKTIWRVVFTFVLLLCSRVWADAGIFAGTGQNLKQISTESVQLVSIDVKITLERGPTLFNGSGLDEVAYDCKFVLRNLTDKQSDVQVGFPIDSQFAKLLRDGSPPASVDWVGEYSFNARDEGNTYHVDFQRTDPSKEDNHYSAIFTWMMRFKAKETRTLVVQYRMPISMALYPASKHPEAYTPAAFQEHPWMELLNTSVLEFAGYTTETGSSWAGNVDKGTFTVATEPFEAYLNYRGLFEPENSDMATVMAERNPVHHVLSYRDIKPLGWQPVEGGIQWQYNNFKPKDPITIHYFLIQIPQAKSDVNPWIDAILRTVHNPHQRAAELVIARQILLASYGQEPTDSAALKFAQDQIWYAPKKDFAISNLTAEQKAVLAELDHRLESIKQGK